MRYIIIDKGTADMELLRSTATRTELERLYRDGDAGDKQLRSYYLPEYQRQIIDLLSEESGASKAAVLRAIIDQWCNQQIGEDGR